MWLISSAETKISWVSLSGLPDDTHNGRFLIKNCHFFFQFQCLFVLFDMGFKSLCGLACLDEGSHISDYKKIFPKLASGVILKNALDFQIEHYSFKSWFGKLDTLGIRRLFQIWTNLKAKLSLETKFEIMSKSWISIFSLHLSLEVLKQGRCSHRIEYEPRVMIGFEKLVSKVRSF